MLLRRFAAVAAALSCLLLCSCAERPYADYKNVIAYAAAAQHSAVFRQYDGGVRLQNSTMEIDLPESETGILAVSSLQTGETLLKNTFVTTVCQADGSVGTLTGTELSAEQERYRAVACRTEQLRIPCAPEQGQKVVAFSFSDPEDRTAFRALRNNVMVQEEPSFLRITANSNSHAQFGARDLSIHLPEEKMQLVVTLRSSGVGALEYYFATNETPLSRTTLLGRTDLTEASEETFVRFTVPTDNLHWKGTLKTLLIRLIDGKEGWVEFQHIELQSLPDTVLDAAAQTRITLYGDRAYLSHTFSADLPEDAVCATEITVARDLCKKKQETADGVALQLIDGSVFGVVRPDETVGNMTLTEGEDIALRITWNRSGGSTGFGTRIYLEYTDSTEKFFVIASRERTPLTEADFEAENLTFNGYRTTEGIYSFTAQAEEAALTVLPGDRTIFVDVQGADAWQISDENGALLPVFAETTVPLYAELQPMTFRLKKETVSPVEPISLFSASDWNAIACKNTSLNGFYGQTTTEYLSSDGRRLLSATQTRSTDGAFTLWEITCTFQKNCTVADFRSTVPLFEFALEHGFESYAYLNEENEPAEGVAGVEETCFPGAMPYLQLSADTEQCGWLITQSTAQIGGEKRSANLCFRYKEADEQAPNRWEMSFDLKETEFTRGDVMTVQIVTIPGADREQLIDLRASGNFRLIQKETLPTEFFTAAGAEDNVIVCAEGFGDYHLPDIRIDGETFNGIYRVYPDRTGGFGFTFFAPNGSEITLAKK